MPHVQAADQLRPALIRSRVARCSLFGCS